MSLGDSFFSLTGRRRGWSWQETQTSDAVGVGVVARQEVEREQRRQAAPYQESHRQNTDRQKVSVRVQG